MTRAIKRAVASYRRRARRKGIVRLEVQVPREDADTVRAVAGLLRGDDPALADRVRRQLAMLARATNGQVSLKELLASAPLEGLDLERRRDLGRDVDLG